jgi:hypothetical protein
MKFIQIETPCQENWENMHVVPEGKYCNLCSKKVLDLTQTANDEILKILESSNGQICGRIYKYQSDKETYDFENRIPDYKKKKNYSGLITGLALVTSLNGINVEARATEKPLIQISENKDVKSKKPEKEKTSDDNFIISGKLINSETGKPLDNIEITLITLYKIFKVRTNQNGEYKMTIPEFYINKKKNVLHLDFGGYNDKNYILTKDELRNKKFSFKDDEINDMLIIAGGISIKKTEPTIFLDGEEITEEEYEDLNKKTLKIYHFNGKLAEALNNDSSTDGLTLVFSK